MIVPIKYIALLGLLPLGMGLYGLYKVGKFWYKTYTGKTNHNKSRNSASRSETESFTSQFDQGSYQKFSNIWDNPTESELDYIGPYSIEGYATIPSPSDYESPNLSIAESSVDTAMEMDGYPHGLSDGSSVWQSLSPFVWFTRGIKLCFHPNVIFVSVLMLAEGSEEIVVFSSLFTTTTSRASVVCMVVTMYVLCSMMCMAAYMLMTCGSVASAISRYSKNILPFLLMGLGVLILQDSVLIVG
ncbi:hypothetical protein EON63_05915 [archaeon]|nr:MAG: hypothetical protein EON63_05915 [archaeon]